MALEPSVLTEDSSSDMSSDEARNPTLKTLFRDKNNRPLKFFFHKSIYKEDQRRRLEKDIFRHGGRVVKSDLETDLVLVLPGRANKDVIQTGYDASSDHRLNKVYVQYTTFIRTCIKEGAVVITKKIKGMGGRPPGRWRADFTFQDDEQLCYYLSRLIPEKESGGRQGIGFYKRLMALAKEDPERYGWATRHTAESWKERYKKNQAVFDARINQLVEEDPPTIKQRWPEDRRATRANQKELVELDSEGEEIEPEDEQEQDLSAVEDNLEAPRKRRRSNRQSDVIEPAAKRLRRSSRHEGQANASGGSVHNKGKDKSIEQGEERSPEFETPAEDFEPQPQGHFRSPERTLVASAPTHRPDLSQETLRNTPPSEDASTSRLRQNWTRNRHSQQRKIVHSSPSHSLSPSQFRPSQNDGFFLDRRSPSPIFTPKASPPPSSFVSQAQPRPASPVQHTLPLSPSPPKLPSQPRTRAARRPPISQPVLDESAPYRNTRSRSRSVEPVVLPPPASRKARRPKETIPEEESDMEPTDTEDINQPSGESPPNGETAVDEGIVEDMLVAQTIETNNGQNLRREASLETDDAQIAASLRSVVPVSSQIRARQGFSSLHKRPGEVLAQFQNRTFRLPTQLDSRSSLRRSDADLTRHFPSQSDLPVRESPRMQRESLPFNFAVPAYDPHTPGQRTRKVSTSSVESFPASGTRASALKKNRQLQEKQTPYEPPHGTRAALFAKAR